MLKIYIINYLHMSKICTFEIIIIYFLKYLSYFASGYLQCPQNKVPFYTNSIQHSKHGPSSCISQYNLKLVCFNEVPSLYLPHFAPRCHLPRARTDRTNCMLASPSHKSVSSVNSNSTGSSE